MPKRLLILFASCALFYSGTLLARAPEPVPNAPTVPALQLPDLQGRMVDLSSFKGNVLLVNFWATWCPPCREEMPSIWKLKNAMHGKPFKVIAVNVGETEAEVNAFLPKAMKRDFVVLLDKLGVTPRLWQISGFPTTYIVDKQGRARYRLVGPTDWDSFENKQRISNLMSEVSSEPVVGTEKLGVKLFLR